MKTIYISSLILFLGLNNLKGQNNLSGTYYLTANQITFQFHPSDPQTGTTWFEVIYANGQRGAAPFYINGNILTLCQFNYGNDQSFKIISEDGKSLVLETMYITPVEQFYLQKINTGNSVPDIKGEILASTDGYEYTTAHVEMAIRFAEFVCGIRLNTSERAEAKQKGIAEFKQNPQNCTNELTGLNQQMKQLYELSDIGQIAIARSALVAQLYPAVQSLDDDQLFKQLINKYTPAFAIDQNSGLALTQREVEGFLELNAFYSEMYGLPYVIDEATRQQMQQYLINQFQQGDLQTKQSLCLFSTLNEYIQGSFAQLTPQQKQQFKASLMNSGSNDTYSYSNSSLPDYNNPENLWPAGINTPEEKRAYMAKKRSEIKMSNSTFNVMQDVLMQEHVTSLNIIESIVPEGNYWEVKYY